jgi:hypothetical protein
MPTWQKSNQEYFEFPLCFSLRNLKPMTRAKTQSTTLKSQQFQMINEDVETRPVGISWSGFKSGLVRISDFVV